jgi:hypothetical protein
VLRLEREVEGWKALRFERGSRGSMRVPSGGALSIVSARGRREGSAQPPALNGAGGQQQMESSRELRDVSPGVGATPGAGAVQQAGSRLSRTLTNTKGFL